MTPLDPYTKEPLIARRARVVELDEVIDLAVLSFEHSLSSQGPKGPSLEQLKDARRKDLRGIYRFWGNPDLAVFVIRDSRDALLGHIIIGGGETHTLRLSKQARIYDISVTPEAKGTGIADLLMEVGESFARKRGYELMALTVTEENTRAVRFYEKQGYFSERIQMLKDLSEKKNPEEMS